jgi:MraZ protein
MSLFMGLHQSRLDAKGRVSIPAPFRAVLRARAHDRETPDLVMRASHNFNCIEGWAARDIVQLSEKLDVLAEFSAEANDLNLVLFGEAQSLPLDREGRVVLPEQMLEHAQIKDAITIVGTRNTFQLWEPAAYERRRAEARANAPSIKLPGAAS